MDAVGDGGPMDGTVLGDDAADHYEVATADGARWRYVRTDVLRDADAPGDPPQRLFRCSGRC